MKILSALLGVSFWESLTTIEWIYIGIGAVTLIVLAITVGVAIKLRKAANKEKQEAVQDVQPAELPAVEEKQPEAQTEESAEVVEEQVEVAPAPQEEVIQEQAPQEEAKPVEEPVVAEQQPQAQAIVSEDRDTEVIRRGKVQIRYDKSQTAKLMQSDKQVKDYYDEIKNDLLSYKGVKCRVSWKHETFRKGRVCVAKLKVRGKHLRLLLPLNPKDYIDTKYKVKDLSDKKAHADTPCGYSIKNDRRSRYAKELIEVVMQANGVEKTEQEFVKYSKEYPYDTTDNLIYRKLIKLIYGRAVDGVAEGEPVRFEPVQSITAEEVTTLMTDEEAEQSVEESSRIADKTKTGIVNVDVLSKAFEAGEKVTLDEIKKRITGFNKKTTYVKVLARGYIDKPLTVEADDYSLDAVKMILLTGGTVIRTKKK